MADLVAVGRVGRSHGIDGSVVVEDASDDPRWFRVGATLFAGDAAVQVTASKRARGRPVVGLDPAVERGVELCVRREDLPEPEEGSYYVFELVGLRVEEEGGRMLGQVLAVDPGVANDVLDLDSGLVLPLHEACVLEVDLDAGRILVARGFADAG